MDSTIGGGSAAGDASRARQTTMVQRVLGDVTGGVMAALVAIPQAIPFGIMVFSPLGPSYVWLGIVSGLVSAILGSLACVTISSIRTQICGPRAATAIVLSSLVAALAAQPDLRAADGTPAAGAIFVLLCLSVIAAGLIQVLLGWLRIGQAVKLIPHPVLTGFLIGLAALLALKQLPVLLGLEVGRDLWSALAEGATLDPTPALIAGITLVAIFVGGSWITKVPPIATGFVVGCAAAIGFSLAGGQVGPTLSVSGSFHIPLLPLDAGVWDVVVRVFENREFLATWVVYILIVAIVSSIEALLSLVAYDEATSAYSDSNRELVAQGFSNVVAGAFGGITSVGATVRTMTNRDAGGRTSLSVWIHSGVMAALLFMGGALSILPQAVLAGIMLHVALNMVDWWPWRLARDVIGKDTRRKGQIGTLAVVALTAAVTIGFDSLIAVGVGVILSIAVFARDMSRPIMRRVTTGAALRSRTVRTLPAAEALAALAGQTTVAQLDGPLFFGTADAVRRWAEELDRQRTRQIILDADRIVDIDVTGAHILRQTAARLADKGIGAAISGLPANDPRRRNLIDFGLGDAFEWFDDLDQALEWAEDRLLAGSAPATLQTGAAPHLAVDHGALMAGLSDAERAFVASLMREISYERDSILFSEGDRGVDLFVLVKGSVRIELTRAARSIRLSTIAPGVVFGEMALLDERPRSATARAETDVIVKALSRDALAQLAKNAPGAAAVLMHNLAREIASRLRLTNSIVAGSLEG
jgi:SulP family sulfate permease